MKVLDIVQSQLQITNTITIRRANLNSFQLLSVLFFIVFAISVAVTLIPDICTSPLSYPASIVGLSVFLPCMAVFLRYPPAHVRSHLRSLAAVVAAAAAEAAAAKQSSSQDTDCETGDVPRVVVAAKSMSTSNSLEREKASHVALLQPD